MPDHDSSSIPETLRQREALEAAAAKDPRYDIEAYLFVCDAVDYTCQKIGERRDIGGRELLDGICDLALDRYGYLAHLVLEYWGVTRTDDFGEIVFNLVDVGLLGKSSRDSRDDFHDVFDLRQTMQSRYDIDSDLGSDAEA